MISADIRRRIELSGTLPLSINFDTPRLASKKYRAYFFSNIRHTISRWRYVSIPDLHYWDHYFKFPSHPSFSSLKELSVDRMDENYQTLWSCSFPNLETLRFFTIGYFPFQTTFPSLRRCEITTYAIRRDRLQTILSCIPTVESLWIELNLSDDNDPSSGEVSTKICLPHLEKLAIKDTRGDSFSFLRTFSLPKINTLSLSSSPSGLGRAHMDQMVSARDTFPVQFLELGLGCTKNGHLGSILMLFPSVRDLHLNVGKELDFEASSWSGINKRRCSNLEVLLIKHGSGILKTLQGMLHGVDLEGIKLEFSENQVFLV